MVYRQPKTGVDVERRHTQPSLISNRLTVRQLVQDCYYKNLLKISLLVKSAVFQLLCSKLKCMMVAECEFKLVLKSMSIARR